MQFKQLVFHTINSVNIIIVANITKLHLLLQLLQIRQTQLDSTKKANRSLFF